MKIKTDQPSRIITQQPQKPSKGREANKFNEILKRTVESTEAQAQKDTQAVSSAQIIQTIGALGEGQGPILERVEQLLDTLEEYQRNLGSATIPSDELKPLINRMEEHNKALAVVLVTLPDGDAMKDILNRVLITSVVEVEKFRRGDYS